MITNNETESRYRILAVDDEKANLNLLRRTLRSNYELLLAENGSDGVQQLQRQPVDMIITDQRMPGMTGIQMLIESKSYCPNAIRMILTAYADVKDIIDSINQGQVYRYILKPWSPDELRITIVRAFEHYSLERKNAELVVQLQQSLEDLKRAQQELLQQERLSTIGRMASSIIHDLRLPMTNIRAGASLLAGDKLTPERRKEFSDVILREVDRLTLMTREILDYSRGEMNLKSDIFKFEDLLNDISNDLAQDFESTRMTLKKEWGAIGEFNGDRERLRRALLNLAINARDAMVESGKLTLRCERDSQNLHIILDDTGPGFPPEMLDRVFEPFVTHGKYSGTGLGMTIAKKIIDAHNGNISAKNRPEGGARITIILPLDR